MSIRSRTVCFSPDVNDLSTIILKEASGSIGGNGGRILRNKKKRNNGTQRLSPMRFLIRLGTKVADAIRGVSIRRKSSRKVSSSSTLVKSCSISDLNDPHRAETVEDCIEFLHSSSCRERPSFSIDSSSTKFC